LVQQHLKGLSEHFSAVWEETEWTENLCQILSNL